MAVITEGKRTAEYLVSEPNGLRGRESATLKAGQNLETGTLLGKITDGGADDGKVTRYDPSASDGSETVYGILYANVDATNADAVGIAITVRDTIVRDSSLTYSDGADADDIATAVAGLRTLGIVLDKR